MLKVAAMVFGLIIVVMVAGPYFHFNPLIPILLILGFGVYMVGRIAVRSYRKAPRLASATPTGFICIVRTSCCLIPIHTAAASCTMASIRTIQKRAE